MIGLFRGFVLFSGAMYGTQLLQYLLVLFPVGNQVAFSSMKILWCL
jgi:hypothetical protein